MNLSFAERLAAITAAAALTALQLDGLLALADPQPGPAARTLAQAVSRCVAERPL